MCDCDPIKIWFNECPHSGCPTCGSDNCDMEYPGTVGDALSRPPTPPPDPE